MSQLVEFYRGTGEDAEGRKLADVWAFSDDEMEFHHDFIQWIFPLQQASRFNPYAPILSDRDIAAFQDEPVLRDNLKHSFDRFLAFVGLEEKDGRVVPAADFESKRQIFLAPDHNWLRITRALTSLRLLGLPEQSEALYEGLLDLIKDGQARITAETRRFWKNAARPDAGD
ncbi:opioid growth factor receptor-related protein [Paludisphaera rhizosphaerae]|uniref:opioid growth factor receptor-related protein n=1 Tax=Paludisphaera rhizosphaerae TaxID=2711216 RepID=UPI0013EA309B|nr:opioid growth factor receptor-related protein [Paludisphaera rhizosphaerae]